MPLAKRILRLLTLVLPLLLLPACSPAQLVEYGDGGPGPFKAQHLTVELTSLSPAAAPGGKVTVGLVITLEEHWHVYWKNAGDSGEPPAIRWTLPRGITAGPMQFPVPSRLPLGPLMDFGYEDTVGFPVELTAAPSLKPGKVHLDARVTWLVCRETCIPGKAHLGLDLDVQPNAPAGQPVGALGQALKELPRPLPPGASFTVTGGDKDFLLQLKTGERIPDSEFYPNDPDQIANAEEQAIDAQDDGVKLTVRRAVDPDHPQNAVKLPSALAGIMKVDDDVAYEVSAPVVPGHVAPANLVPPMAANQSAAAPATAGEALGFIGLAFLGGIILNLMPCVFPVLFLKGLALLQSSGEERRRMRLHGLVYTLGIVASFWLIVALLLVLRAGGSQFGWGFQLQSPAFVAVLAAGLFFFALSLAGQFDLGLSLTSAGGSLAQRQGLAGSFFTGVLATVVATPCVGPFMGAAVGFALAQSALVTFAVFSALALGLAFPYLLLTLQPQWMSLLPRPGAWMETLKQLTAVPLLGTAIWLTWVFGNLSTARSGVDAMARLLWCFLVLAIAGWALGRWPARWGSAVAAVLLAIAALAIPLSPPRKDTLDWQPYSAEALAAARQAGQPVFIDFTAAWCLSCQVNERVVLHSTDVEHELAGHHFVLMRADWTHYDPAITQQLASIGRSGVPTYVIYPAAASRPADVLPEVLSKGVVLDAIAKDTR